MGDMADDFRVLRKHNQEVREQKRANAVDRLMREGIPFVSKNAGAHLIVLGSIDYWPGPGHWRDRKSTHKGRGIVRLLRLIRQQQAPQEPQ